ncbi:MAG: hypothetical protein SX243_12725 [Acidobacteriota bacterium]|nr:hypothetical protein [Acidobacteriota bacterium]
MAQAVDIQALAVSYRRLVQWVGVQLLLMFSPAVLELVVSDDNPVFPVASLAIGLIALASVFALAIYGYRTARALGSNLGFFWALAMLLPCVNLLVLLALSSRATQACRAEGVEVGLLGPKI